MNLQTAGVTQSRSAANGQSVIRAMKNWTLELMYKILQRDFMSQHLFFLLCVVLVFTVMLLWPNNNFKSFQKKIGSESQIVSDLLSEGGSSVLSWPHPPRQPGQDERDEDGGEQVDRVIVQDGFPTYPPCGGGLVTHHLLDARVEAWRHEEEETSSC